MINFKFFACEPRVYYPLRNPYYIDLPFKVVVLHEVSTQPLHT